LKRVYKRLGDESQSYHKKLLRITHLDMNKLPIIEAKGIKINK